MLVAGAALWLGVSTPAPAMDEEWPIYGGNYAKWYYSRPARIDRDNVKRLSFAWARSLGNAFGQESTPLVIGDTLFVTSANGPRYVVALDAATGAIRWKVELEMPAGVQQYACCAVVNRGVAYSDGMIYVGRLDGALSAFDAETGEEKWTVEVVDDKQGSMITSPPLVVKDVVITGFGGGEYGARGYIVAYDKKTGKERWKTRTVPGPGEPGNETWKGDSWKHGGGTVRLIGSYDPERDLAYFGTSNPAPWAAHVRGPNTPDFGQYSNKWTSATIAVDPDDGRIVWGFQGTPHDAWDYDGVNELVLVDIDVTGDGRPDPVGLEADRNGFFFVVDRTNGKVLSADPFVYTNWAKSWDIAAQRPIEDPAKRPGLGKKAVDICPNLVGGKNWQPMARSPDTKLVYIPANNLCMDMEDAEVEYKRGSFFLGKEFTTKPGPGGHLGELIAWDPVARKKVWGIPEKWFFNGGVLATGGGLVFAGNYEGFFRAIDAETGEVLWQRQLGSGIHAAPATYEVGGKQYVVVAVGRSDGMPQHFGEIGRQMIEAQPTGGMLFAFTLD
ncbi:MAG: PQQ-dependent dehydrogenase, methanol/ethanol family [Geminicoccaceae bacterium]|nr:PQQ-dependent dehydrogenase, methanol/ethanol family [Geminicoccaceae bacterium]MDW8123936.1 PQQ-dependent dehydrogenase, methanol/ethanol family [Geminicoccaceae bacterium]MDW8340001.1 PQQ-dependent dehydrogenase, methanol/ethanol family [Geminicoccaceae bacterium]